MKLKKIAAFCLAAVLLCGGIYTTHYYGDEIYGFLFYKEYEVVKADDTTLKVAKDHPVEALTEYLESQGWEFTDQFGSCVHFTKDNTVAVYDIDYKNFYALCTQMSLAESQVTVCNYHMTLLQ